MKTYSTLLLTSLLIASLFIACSPQTDATTAKAEAFRKKIETEQRDLEIYQIFAAAEVEKHLSFVKKQNEFTNASIIEVLDEFDELIPIQQNIDLAKKRLLDYLNSDNFKMDAIKLSLADDFKATTLASLQAAQTSTTQLKAITETVTRIARHKANARTYAYDRSLTQRLNDLNGDTIELKQNTAYLFPTEFFLNDKLMLKDDAIEALEPTFIKASGTVGNIEKVELSIPVRANSAVSIKVDVALYVKTVE